MTKIKTPKTPVCSICHQPYQGFGNNAQPVNDGRCCNDCNWMYVIPARLRILQSSEREETKS